MCNCGVPPGFIRIRQICKRQIVRGQQLSIHPTRQLHCCLSDSITCIGMMCACIWRLIRQTAIAYVLFPIYACPVLLQASAILVHILVQILHSITHTSMCLAVQHTLQFQQYLANFLYM